MPVNDRLRLLIALEEALHYTLQLEVPRQKFEGVIAARDALAESEGAVSTALIASEALLDCYDLAEHVDPPLAAHCLEAANVVVNILRGDERKRFLSLLPLTVVDEPV